MDMHPNAQAVLRGFQAFAEGDMATMKELYHPDAVWHTSGRNQFSGDYRGPDAIIRFFGEITAEASVENDLHAILADDDHVVVLTNGKLSRGDEVLDTQNVFIFHLADGKVTETWLTALDPYASDEFWG